MLCIDTVLAMAERGNQPYQSTGIEKGDSPSGRTRRAGKNHNGQNDSGEAHGRILSSIGREQGLHGMGTGTPERKDIRDGHSEKRFEKEERRPVECSGADEERVSVRQKEPLERSMDRESGNTCHHQRGARQEPTVQGQMGRWIHGTGVHRR